MPSTYTATWYPFHSMNTEWVEGDHERLPSGDPEAAET